MAIRFQCSACSQPIEVDNEWALRTVACPYCHKTITAPGESTLGDLSQIPTAAPLTAQEGYPAPPAAELRGHPGGDTHPNRIAVVAFVLACVVIVLLASCATIVAGHSLEILQLQEDVQKGKVDGKSQFEVVLEYLEHYGGVPPPWMLLVGMLEVTAAVGCLAGLVCGILGLRHLQRRWFAIAALVISGGVLVMFCGSVVFSCA